MGILRYNSRDGNLYRFCRRNKICLIKLTEGRFKSADIAYLDYSTNKMSKNVRKQQFSLAFPDNKRTSFD